MLGLESSELPKLRELHLTNNKLHNLRINYKCDMLDMLILCNNLFVDLQNLVINELINIRHLILSGNRLKQINFKWFRFSCLEFLDLSYNVIEETSMLADARMPNLFELNLGSNRLTQNTTGSSASTWKAC